MRRGLVARRLAALLLLPVLLPAAAGASTLPDGFVEKRLAAGLDRPTAMTITPDGRILVCEEKGRLRLIKDGVLLAKPVLEVRVFAHGERGLLGVVVDPDFAQNGYVYIYYTARKPTAHNRISRFVMEGDVARKGSETVILELPPLVTELHSAGTLRFGPDGKLYASVGENFIAENAQKLSNPLGKILRLNRDGTIPADNPFYAQTTGSARAIWSLGLRNPFSFVFERGAGGRMFINDVGRRAWEEINEGAAGANYGWPIVEGPADDPRFQPPLFAYAHGGGLEKGCAITGGAFYDSPIASFPSEYAGTYLYSDFCNGWIRRLEPSTGETTLFARGIESPVGLTVGEDGDVYYLAHVEGAVYRVSYTGSNTPAISVQPQDLRVAAGEPATFEVKVSGASPFTFQWRRDKVAIPGATAAQFTLGAAALGDDGDRFDVVVKNSFGTVISRSARLAVVAGQRPVAAISTPASGTLYRAGDTIAFHGGATDADDGALPPAALTWWIDFHHDDHFHPFLLHTPGLAGGSFTVPQQGEPAPNVWYRVHLSARDSDGLEATTAVDVVPRLATIGVATEPAGLRVTLDGTPRSAPFQEVGVVGILRTLGVVSPQVSAGGVLYDFLSWSDGGAAAHTITTPEVDTTWTATFRQVLPGTGIGLTGQYFASPDFSGAAVSRLDPTVNFTWGDQAPVPGVGPDDWSARWTGEVEPLVTGPHTFFVRSDDGARLWVNGTLVVDDWTDHASRVRKGTIELAGGQRYSLRLDYHDTSGPAGVRLLWSAPEIPRQLVPASQLFP